MLSTVMLPAVLAGASAGELDEPASGGGLCMGRLGEQGVARSEEGSRHVADRAWQSGLLGRR